MSASERNKAVHFLKAQGEQLRALLVISEGLHLPDERLMVWKKTDTVLLILTVVIPGLPCLQNYVDRDLINGVITGKIEKRIAEFLGAEKRERERVEIDWVRRCLEVWVQKKTGRPVKGPSILRKLSPRQNALVTGKTKSGYRRIRGAAGCGKSLVLAARGARLLREGHRVLFLTYNIVAARYLQELTAEILAGDGVALGGVEGTFIHMHGLFGTLSRYNFWPGSEYDKLSREEQSRLKNQYLDVTWCDEAMQAAEALDDSARYDAIMVDEGQDLRKNWWPLVQKMLRPGGELVLVADRTQNIYGIPPWTETEMQNAGFTGAWFTLENSYRLPEALLMPIANFIRHYLPDQDTNEPVKPEPRHTQISIFHNTLWLRWVQMKDMSGPEDVASAAYRKYEHIIEISQTKRWARAISASDVVFLVDTNETGRALESEFALQEIPFFSTIDNQKAKESFSMSIPLAKITTIKSFKGLESPVVIMVIGRRFNYNSVCFSKEIYVAMTRVKENTECCSFLSVICVNPQYRDYGRSWQMSQEYFIKNDFIKGKFIDHSGMQMQEMARNVSVETSWQAPPDMLFGRDIYDAVMKHSANAGQLDVNSNLGNTPEENAAYLHDYFFRSYTENYIFWKGIFAHPPYAEHVRNRGTLKFLSYGCGTGGDIAGFAAALGESGILGGGTLQIHAVDGNRDALHKCRSILASLFALWHFNIHVSITSWVNVADKNGFFLQKELQQKAPFDIIQTSKMLNEMLPYHIGAYYTFMTQVVLKLLDENGLALIEDVPVKRRVHTTNEERALTYEENCWAPCLLSDQAANFVRNSKGKFSIAVPTPCDGCTVANCYSATLYTYSFFSGRGPTVLCTLSCRMLASGKMKDIFKIADGSRRITCRRKDGSFCSCEKNPTGKISNLLNKNTSFQVFEPEKWHKNCL